MLVVPVMSVHQGGYSLNWERKVLRGEIHSGPPVIQQWDLAIQGIPGKGGIATGSLLKTLSLEAVTQQVPALLQWPQRYCYIDAAQH